MRRTIIAFFYFAAFVMAQDKTSLPDLARLKQMSARFAPTPLHVDQSGLPAGDRAALAKLIEAARLVNQLFMQQMWSRNLQAYQSLQSDKSPLGQERLHYFWLNKGPWSEIDEHTAFIPGVPARKLQGANFYPEDMTKIEFEAWVKTLAPAQKEQAEGFFTVIRRGPDRKLTIVPYSQEYKTDLNQLSKLLREASDLTPNTTLKKFLTGRAAAFLSNDYYESDLSWMDLDAPLDITIGPYETYNDELFGYKAAFEAYITIRDEKESERLKTFAARLQEIEDHLPIDPKYRNPKLGPAAPIRVVNEVYAAGDGAHGVRTAAFNLPNDEGVGQEKGHKRVMLKNIQEAKFQSILTPVAGRVLPKAAQADLSFDSFFEHILAHELSHGIGPHQIQVNGRATTPRQELKELYSAIEEAKADVTGLFMLQYLLDHGMPHGPAAEHQLYTTFLASAFRSLRFGLTDAHGKGMALQFNYLSDKGGFTARPGGTFAVDFAKVKGAVQDLTHDLLTIEAQGDYAGAKRLLDTLGVVRPGMQRALDGLKNLPTDIDPVNE